MARRHRKSRKYRGSRTCGWGRQAQHRRSSRKGGRGRAGTHAHKWRPPEPKYKGKHGFRSIWAKEPLVINVGEVNELLDTWLEQGSATVEKEWILVDLAKLGYDKLLGRGTITRPVSVKVPDCSASALKKIEEAGGRVIKAN